MSAVSIEGSLGLNPHSPPDCQHGSCCQAATDFTAPAIRACAQAHRIKSSHRGRVEMGLLCVLGSEEFVDMTPAAISELEAPVGGRRVAKSDHLLLSGSNTTMLFLEKDLKYEWTFLAYTRFWIFFKPLMFRFFKSLLTGNTLKMYIHFPKLIIVILEFVFVLFS